MFSNPLPDNLDYRVVVSKYAQRYYLKRFVKDYKGARWLATESSMLGVLRRVHAIQATNKVDELRRGSGCLLFKYDFAIAQSGVSPKASGNRCVVFLDIEKHTQTILLAYGKTDLPKNQGETAYIMSVVEREYKEFWERLG